MEAAKYERTQIIHWSQIWIFAIFLMKRQDGGICTALQRHTPKLRSGIWLMSLSFLCDFTERMWHCLDQGTTSKKQDLEIINGSSNYWGATSKGPAWALALFIIYEAGLQLQPSKAFNWLIAASAAQKQKSNATSEPRRTTIWQTHQSVSLVPLISRTGYVVLFEFWQEKKYMYHNTTRFQESLGNSCAALLKPWRCPERLTAWNNPFIGVANQHYVCHCRSSPFNLIYESEDGNGLLLPQCAKEDAV